MIYKSCRFIEHGIFFKLYWQDQFTLTHCCNMDGQCPSSEQLYLIKNFDGKNIDWNDIFRIKNELRENHKNGKFHPVCERCWELTEKDWDNENYINDVIFSHWTKCNSRCVYCHIGNDEKQHSAEQTVSMMPIIKEMYNQNILRFDGSLRFVGGEPTVAIDFEELVDFFVDNRVKEIVIPSSGIKFSKAMEHACKDNGECKVFISIDAGSRETYKKIKRVDAYERVIENIKSYIKVAQDKTYFISKYIIVKGLNDNKKEIDMWLKKCVSIGISNVGIDIEFSIVHGDTSIRYKKHLLYLVDYAYKKAEKIGLTMNKDLPYVKKALEQYAYLRKIPNFNNIFFKIMNTISVDLFEK